MIFTYGKRAESCRIPTSVFSYGLGAPFCPLEEKASFQNVLTYVPKYTEYNLVDCLNNTPDLLWPLTTVIFRLFAGYLGQCMPVKEGEKVGTSDDRIRHLIIDFVSVKWMQCVCRPLLVHCLVLLGFH